MTICEQYTKIVKQCHREHGKDGEDCVRDELIEKKCFAQKLCKAEATSFYEEKLVPLKNHMNGTTYAPMKASCSTVVEVFAKPENELEIPEGLTKEDRKYCRKITHELAKCLARKKIWKMREKTTDV